MAREGLLVGLSEEELKPSPKLGPPKTPKGKLENFWYHYKWHTLVGVFVVVVLTILTVQMVTRTKPDYLVLLITENFVPEEATKSLQYELEKYGEDINNDGKIVVTVDSLYFPKDPNIVAANQAKLTANLATGDVLFYVFDDKIYEKQMKQLESEITFFSKPKIEIDGINSKNNYWNWKSSNLQKQVAFKNVPKDLYFGIRNATGTAEKKQEVYKQNVELFERFLQNVNNDYNIVLATQKEVDDSTKQQFTAQLEKCIQETNLDKEKSEKLVVHNVVLENEDKKQRQAQMSRLNAYANSHNSLFYIFDETSFKDYISQRPQDEDLGPFFAKPDFEDSNIDKGNYYWNWKSTNMQKKAEFKNLPQDLYFGISKPFEESQDSDFYKSYAKLFEEFVTLAQRN